MSGLDRSSATQGCQRNVLIVAEASSLKEWGDHSPASPLPICFSKDCRTSPITYGNSASELNPTSTSPFPQRPRLVTSLHSPLGSWISWKLMFSESRSRLDWGSTSTKLVSAL